MPNKNSENPTGKKPFEDFFSDAHIPKEAPQDFEDISSGKKEDESIQETYEDFFTGRESEEENKDDLFSSSFFSEMPEAEKAEFEAESTEPQKDDTAPQNRPYSYHYSSGDGENTRAKNGDVIASGQEPPKKPKRKKHLKRNITLSVLAGLLAIILLLTGIGYGTLQKTLSLVDTKPLTENKFIEESKLLSSPDVTNILLIGSDAREGQDTEKTRSDTMLLISMDKKNRQIKFTSFLRDLYVDIPGYRKDKINAANSHGGVQLLVDTLETNFKIRIDGYVLVTFDIFRAAVDALGGVDVEITEKEANYINSKDHMAPEDVAAFPEPLTEGKQHFTGAQALWYSRIRYLDSDFMRTARQRKVLFSILHSAKKKGPAALLSVAKEVLPMLKTSYTGDEILSLGFAALGALKYETFEQQIPAKDAYKSERKRGQSCLVPNMEKNREILKNFIFEAQVKEEEKDEK